MDIHYYSEVPILAHENQIHKVLKYFFVIESFFSVLPINTPKKIKKTLRLCCEYWFELTKTESNKTMTMTTIGTIINLVSFGSGGLSVGGGKVVTSW